MYFIKKILIGATVSLVAGIASAIGTRVGGVIWDKCPFEKEAIKYSK